MSKAKPKITQEALFVCRLKGSCTGYGKTPKAAYNDRLAEVRRRQEHRAELDRFSIASRDLTDHAQQKIDILKAEVLEKSRQIERLQAELQLQRMQVGELRTEMASQGKATEKEWMKRFENMKMHYVTGICRIIRDLEAQHNTDLSERFARIKATDPTPAV